MHPIALLAEKYPSTFMTWETKDGNPVKTSQEWGCYSSFVTLIELGADIGQDYGSGWTPLLTAMARGNNIFTPFIIEHKPDLNAVAHDEQGRAYTALKLAIDHHDTDAIRMLVERGADETLEIETKDGSTMLPADYARSKGQPKAAEMLELAAQIRAMHAQKSGPFLMEQIERPASPGPLAPRA